MNRRRCRSCSWPAAPTKWAQPKEFPWTIGWQPSYRTEGQIYAKYILRTKPDAKVGVLYQNDDFGKDYLAGLRDVFAADTDKRIVKAASYETSDPHHRQARRWRCKGPARTCSYPPPRPSSPRRSSARSTT